MSLCLAGIHINVIVSFSYQKPFHSSEIHFISNFHSITIIFVFHLNVFLLSFKMLKKFSKKAVNFFNLLKCDRKCKITVSSPKKYIKKESFQFQIDWKKYKRDNMFWRMEDLISQCNKRKRSSNFHCAVATTTHIANTRKNRRKLIQLTIN